VQTRLNKTSKLRSKVVRLHAGQCSAVKQAWGSPLCVTFHFYSNSLHRLNLRSLFTEHQSSRNGSTPWRGWRHFGLATAFVLLRTDKLAGQRPRHSHAAAAQAAYRYTQRRRRSHTAAAPAAYWCMSAVPLKFASRYSRQSSGEPLGWHSCQSTTRSMSCPSAGPPFSIFIRAMTCSNHQPLEYSST
jgi:hypothetical protein